MIGGVVAIAGGKVFSGLSKLVGHVPAKKGGGLVGRGLAHGLNKLFEVTWQVPVGVATKAGGRMLIVGIHDSTMASLYPGPVTGWVKNTATGGLIHWQIPANAITALRDHTIAWSHGEAALRKIQFIATKRHPLPPMTGAQKALIRSEIVSALRKIHYLQPRHGWAKILYYAPSHHTKVVVRHAVKKFFQAPPSHTGVPTPEVPPVPVDL